MDAFLGNLTKQAVNYAVRTGFTITANYVFQQSTRLIKRVEGREKIDLLRLQQHLDEQIKVISPAIDMIELISARGNTSLESAQGLTKSIRLQIQSLGQRIAQAVIQEEQAAKLTGAEREVADLEVKQIMADIKELLIRLKDAIPVITLAISTSGANLSGSMPTTVSPSRLLQASTFLSLGDSQYGRTCSQAVQIGPTFNLSLYMLFTGHARSVTEEDVRNTTWKEVIHKARLKLIRVPFSKLYSLPNEHDVKEGQSKFAPSSVRNEYAYQIVIIEDLNDDRVHTFEDDEAQPTPFLDVDQSGIKEIVPVHEVSKLFYADTGKILNIGNDGEMNTPVLLVKRDKHARPPQRPSDDMNEPIDDLQHDAEEGDDETNAVYKSIEGNTPTGQSGLPNGLDHEWFAFAPYVEVEDSDDEGNITPEEAVNNNKASEPELAEAFTNLDLNGSPARKIASGISSLPPIKTSLSLLEVLLRLLSLQQFQQTSHLAVPDEILNFFLSEAATTGAASGDDVERRRIRNEARERLGFDPYDESPIKRRGEAYQYHGGIDQESVRFESVDRFGTPESHGMYVEKPVTPQHLLDNRPHLSPRSTPDLPPLPRSGSAKKSRKVSLSALSRFASTQDDRRDSLPARGNRESSPLAGKGNAQ